MKYLPDLKFLVPLALLLGLAPFLPEPHLFEKLRMLASGTLKKPLDILDLLFHSFPVVLVVLKLVATNLDEPEGE